MTNKMIPVFEPEITDNDIKAVEKAVATGQISGTYGQTIEDFEASFASYCGVKHGIAVSSGTTALHLAVSVLDLDPGSEVMVSAGTNVATALAPFHNQCSIVPIDSEDSTCNIDPSLIETHISERTRAIIPVHLYGHPADMAAINKICLKHNITVIEDAAEAHGSRIGEQRTGSFGEMACFSFYANKTITCGEGGMIVTNNHDLAEELRFRRNLGFGQPRFVHEKAGYNFRMTGMQAALGLSQLSRIDSVLNRKRELADMYCFYLSEIEELVTPVEKPGFFNTYWMFTVRVRHSTVSRQELCLRLREDGVDTRTFFYPISHQPFLQGSQQLVPTNCEFAMRHFEEGLYLPSSLSLTEKQIMKVVECLKEALR